jgi:pimeloyl-ACP methyl ester carboxylesterase
MEYVCDALRYLLALYKQSAVAEASTAEAVILIGHSMGGLVARGVFNHPNYPANSVNTVITLSTPHVQPPAPFSRHLERIYADTNEFWRASFAAAPNLLAEVSILSIAGGTSDSMIDSDTTHLDGIAPQTNCLSVFTTTVPELYSTVDHLAIMWCDQLRNRVAQALLDVVAVSNPSRTKSVQERLAAWRRLFLSGLPVDVFDHQTLEAAVPLVERGPSVELPMAGRFVALSSSDFQVQTCKSGTCSLHPATVRPLPASYRNRPTSNMAPPFWTTSFETTGPSSLHSADSAPSFVMAHPLPEDAILLRWTLLGLLLFQHQFSVPRELALGSTFRFPLLASSLVVYRVYVLPRSCEREWSTRH